jgi:hypothetical protein
MKCRIAFVTAIGFLAGGSACIAQSPLDAAGDKKITVGSEIRRGFNQFYRANDRDLTLAEIAAECERQLDLAQSANRDSAGFLLGARLAELFRLDTKFRSPQGTFLTSDKEIQLCIQIAWNISHRIRDAEDTLSITDDQLLDAIGRHSDDQLKEFHEMIARRGSGGDPSMRKAEPVADRATPLPEFSPLPSPSPGEFVTLTKDFTLLNGKGKEVRTLPAGKRLRVISRDKNGGITVSSFGDQFLIPAAVTEPSN